MAKVSCPKCHFEYELLGAVPRSTPQNRAYFGLAAEKFAKEWHCDKETAHKVLAGEFIGYNEVTISGKASKVVRVPKSSRSLNTKQFSEFFERVQRYGIENWIYIVSPGEVN